MKPSTLQEVTITIWKNQTFQGSGVLVLINEKFYILSAAHVFGDIDGEIFLEQGFIFINENGYEINMLNISSSKSVHKNYDVIAFEVEVNKNKEDFPEVKLCSDTDFPNIEFLFRGASKKNSGKCHTVGVCTKDGESGDILTLKIPHEDYTDGEGEVGSSNLQGYSGSGVFIKTDQDVYLVGIVRNVDEGPFSGVNCTSIKTLSDHVFGEKVLSDYFGGDTVVSLKAREIRKNITKEIIEERKYKDYDLVKNLASKMNAFHEGWTTDDLDKFILDLITWEKIDRHRIRYNSKLRGLIDDSKDELASGNNHYHVASTLEGNRKFHEIRDRFYKIVREHLHGTPLHKNARVISDGEIARLLGNCNLRFIK